jgi:hypothetical protein
MAVSTLGFAVRRGSFVGIRSKKSLDRGEAKIVDIEVRSAELSTTMPNKLALVKGNRLVGAGRGN